MPTGQNYNVRNIMNPLLRFVLTALIGLGGALLWSSSAGKSLDIWTLQQFFNYRGPRKVVAPVVILAVDDESYAELKASPRWRFPVHNITAALQRLVASGPRLVLIDRALYAQSADDQSLLAFREILATVPSFEWDSTSSAVTSMHGVVTKLSFPEQSVSPFVAPLQEFAGLSFLTNSAAPSSNALINFYGEKGTVERVSLHSAIASSAEDSARLFHDKIIVFGFHGVVRQRGQILRDELAVPIGLGDTMFPVELNATIVANLLERSWIERMSLRAELFTVLVGCIVVAGIGIFLFPTRSVPLLLLLLGALTVFAYNLFNAIVPFWISGVAVLWLTAFAGVLCRAAYHAVTVRRATEKLTSTYRISRN